MDVRSIQSSPVYTGATQYRSGRTAAQPPDTTSKQEIASRADNTPVLTTDEKSFFEGLFPESRSDVRAHQAYSLRGGQTTAPKGSLVDRKG
jgi:hypothetical protein